MQFDEGELRGSIDRDKQVELALLGPNLGNVGVKIADRIRLEFPLLGLFAVDVRQAADLVALQTAVQR